MSTRGLKNREQRDGHDLKHRLELLRLLLVGETYDERGEAEAEVQHDEQDCTQLDPSIGEHPLDIDLALDVGIDLQLGLGLGLRLGSGLGLGLGLGP